MTSSRIVVVDDDPQILRALRTGLRGHGYEVSTAPDGESALGVLSSGVFDLVVLDLGLPDIDGHEVIRRLRTFSDVPIVVLSVREGLEDKVAALDAGADDYIVKPFALEELLARIRAVERRVSPETESVLRFGDLEIDLTLRSVVLAGGRIRLTATEYRLLEAMATNAGKLLTHRWLLQKVWGPAYGTESQYVRVFVRQLRRKLGDDPVAPRWILTEPGMGYRWLAVPEVPTSGTSES